jgi:long-chain fatty acid transport protein
MKSALRYLVLGAALASTPPLLATDGYFSHGYGMKAKGRAGVSMTASDDAFGGANNPAAIAWASNRVDIGVEWFHPDREAERTGPASPLLGSVRSDRRDFFIPEMALRHGLSDAFALGISLYGNGGMNTDYAGGQLNLGPGMENQNLLAGSGRLGVDMSQLFVAPTLSWRFLPNHSLGLAPIGSYTRFKARGFDAFSGMSQDPSSLRGYRQDDVFGYGIRVGYLWKATSFLDLGTAYTSRIQTGSFNRYQGLFADDGAFDIPQTFSLGVGWQVLPSVRIAADYKWIDYGSIASVGNPSTNPGPLGDSGGPGFGWQSIHVAKTGIDWTVCRGLVLRAGYGFAENPIQSRDVTINIAAPGVVQHHATAGFTLVFGRHEITAAYMHAFRNSVTGESLFTRFGMAPAGTRETISMSEHAVGIEYGFRY